MKKYRTSRITLSALIVITMLPTLAVQARPYRAAPYGRHYHSVSPRYTVRHSRGWSTAGHILTGVAIGAVLNAAAQPTTREVVTYRNIYTTAPTVVAPTTSYVTVPAVAPAIPAPPEVRETMWVRNSNGSETPVQLRRTAAGSYIGPRGEHYSVRPSHAQLHALYGM